MNDRQRKLIARQIKAQADSLDNLDGTNLAAELIATSSALMRAADAARLADEFPDDEFDATFAHMTGLAAQLTSYFDATLTRLEARANAPENLMLVQELRDKQAQASRLATRRAQLEGDLARIQDEMARLPEENSRLLDQYDEAQTRLTRLRAAREECSPQRQAELQKQIDELAPEVDRMSQKMRLLEGQLSDLRATQRAFDASHAQLAADVDLHAWLSADTANLESLAQKRRAPESTQLAEQMDDNALEHVRQLRKEVVERLAEIDALLGRCAEAARQDHAAVDRRARR